MAKDEKEKTPVEKVEVPVKLLTEMQEQMASLEKKVADNDAKNAGLQELLAKSADAVGSPALREKKNYEPKFRTVRIRKYPIAGDVNNMGYVIGWTNRGAYQEVDRSGVSPQVVDMIDIIFLGQEKTDTGAIKAEKVRLLDLLNRGVQVHCKILKTEKEEIKVPTGEEVSVTTWDPRHGLVDTGEKIDGWVAHSEIKYTIAIPGVADPVVVDSEFLNR